MSARRDGAPLTEEPATPLTEEELDERPHLYTLIRTGDQARR